MLDGRLALEFGRNKRIDETRPPIVFACEWSDEIVFPSVMIDNRVGARKAIEHLYGLGHRNIGHVSGPRGNVHTQAREEGMLEKLRELGLAIRPEWFLNGDFTLQSGLDASMQWLAMREKPTAMFCASDEMAFGFTVFFKDRQKSLI